jgi:hypothetical protein
LNVASVCRAISRRFMDRGSSIECWEGGYNVRLPIGTA